MSPPRMPPMPSPRTLVAIALAFIATVPAWIASFPPIMDWPFHMATIRVVADFGNPDFGFSEDFVLTFGRTQYILFYLLGAGLSFIVGVKGAMILLVCGYLAGTFLGMRALLRALGKDERLALLVIPLLPNVLFYYGLFPFLIGIPFILFGLAVAIRWFEEPTRRRGLTLGVIAFCLFFTHAFPFMIFGLGFAALFPWKQPKRWLRAGLPVLPALLVMLWWVVFTEAGRLSLEAMTSASSDQKLPIDASLAELPHWFLNALNSKVDEVIFVALGVIALLAFALSQGDPDETPPTKNRLYAILPLACVWLYFTSPQGHGYLWLIAQRFPILFAIFVIPLLRMPQGLRGHILTGAMLVLAVLSPIHTATEFRRFQSDEVGAFPQALDAIPPKSRVAALIYDKGSAVTNGRFAPYLHFGSYVQANKGGVIMFTYAGYAHWPFDFREGRAPPAGAPARLRWEWTPEQVPVATEILPYYDYVLVRGHGFRPPRGTFERVFEADRWQVWKNLQRAAEREATPSPG